MTAIRARRSRSKSHRAVTLMEVLLSIGVVFIGLMGAASLFPVASYQIQEGNKHERTALVGKRAVRDARSRDFLDPTRWMARDGSGIWFYLEDLSSIAPAAASVFSPQYRVICLDPRGTGRGVGSTVGTSVGTTLNLGNSFPNTIAAMEMNVDYSSLTAAAPVFSPRVTIESAALSGIPMLPEQADSIFIVEDDLDFELPPTNAAAPLQKFLNVGAGVGGRRLATGGFSWMAFTAPKIQTETRIIPTSDGPKSIQVPQAATSFDLWVVILHERNLNNDALVATEETLGRVKVPDGRGGGEVVLKGDPASSASIHRDIAVGDWVMLRRSVDLSGGDPAAFLALTGRPWFYERMGWYRVLGVDEQLIEVGGGEFIRSATLAGPDWAPNDDFQTYAIRIEGVEGVYRKTFAFN